MVRRLLVVGVAAAALLAAGCGASPTAAPPTASGDVTTPTADVHTLAPTVPPTVKDAVDLVFSGALSGDWQGGPSRIVTNDCGMGRANSWSGGATGVLNGKTYLLGFYADNFAGPKPYAIPDQSGINPDTSIGGVLVVAGVNDFPDSYQVVSGTFSINPDLHSGSVDLGLSAADNGSGTPDADVSGRWACTPSPTGLSPAAVTTAPSPTAIPSQHTCGAPTNPWGYTFCGGNAIDSPPSNFCAYFNCIRSFWESTSGYVEECADGTYSHSGGRSGACSDHGGERQKLYGP